MVDHWRWHGSTRVPRGTRFTAIVGLLLGCMLLAALPAIASANTPEVAGEWTLVLKYSGGTVDGTALVTEEATAKGEFAAHSVTLNGVVPGTFSGTLEGATATVETSSEQYGPIPPGKFNSSTMTVESTSGSLALSGAGMFVIGPEKYSATLVATRIKTYKEVEEREARERQEQEERAARANVRGEWAITLEGGGKTVKGTALVTQEATTKNAFASKSAMFEEGFIGGTFGGTLKGAEAEVTITTDEVPGVLPSGTFASTTIAVSSKANPTSMSGTGTFTFNSPSIPPFPATLTATRIRPYQQIEEQETKEREATEKLQQEERATAEQKAREQKEQEQKARELKERQEREAREAAEKAAAAKGSEGVKTQTVTPLVSALLATKTLTVGSSGSLVLSITNPNAYAVQGHLLLVASATSTGKASGGKGKAKKLAVSFGSASYTISANGHETVKIKLSSAARADLTRNKTLHISSTITTGASGMTSLTKLYTITLHAAKAAHGKH